MPTNLFYVIMEKKISEMARKYIDTNKEEKLAIVKRNHQMDGKYMPLAFLMKQGYVLQILSAEFRPHTGFSVTSTQSDEARAQSARKKLRHPFFIDISTAGKYTDTSEIG